MTLACAVCDSRQFQKPRYPWLHTAPPPTQWVECRDCGLIELTPRPTAEQLAAWYSEVAPRIPPAATRLPVRWKTTALRQLMRASLDARGWYRGFWLTVLHPLAAHFQGLPSPRPPGSALDVGCGDGEWLAVLHRCGWTTTGIERDPRRAMRATVEGVAIWPWDVAEFADRPRAFDVVRCWHVLEHLPDPLGLLVRARRWLRPGGELILGVPNVGGLMHRRFRQHWSGLEHPKHLHHFTEATMARLVGRAGFTQVRVRHRSCGTGLDSLGISLGASGQQIASHPITRLASVYADRCLDLCRVGDALDVRATVTGAS